MGAGASSGNNNTEDPPYPDRETAIANGHTPEEVAKWEKTHVKLTSTASVEGTNSLIDTPRVPDTPIDTPRAPETVIDTPRAGPETDEESNIPVMDWKFAMYQCGAEESSSPEELEETKQFVDEIIQDFLGEAQQCIATILAQFNKRNTGVILDVLHAAHTIKGSGGNVGAKKLSVKGNALQLYCKKSDGVQPLDFFKLDGPGDEMNKALQRAFDEFKLKIEEDKGKDLATLMQ